MTFIGHPPERVAVAAGEGGEWTWPYASRLSSPSTAAVVLRASPVATRSSSAPRSTASTRVCSASTFWRANLTHGPFGSIRRACVGLAPQHEQWPVSRVGQPLPGGAHCSGQIAAGNVVQQAEFVSTGSGQQCPQQPVFRPIKEQQDTWARSDHGWQRSKRYIRQAMFEHVLERPFEELLLPRGRDSGGVRPQLAWH